jgi:RNA ligase
MLTQRQNEIYTHLLDYANFGSDAIYYVDQVWEGVTYRVFAYRLASYTDFMQPDALEARGIMFELDEKEQPVRLACRPMHKFFNLNENPMTMNLNLSQDNISIVMDKVDGSLISSWVDHNGNLQLKSKTSLYSDQVQLAWKYLKHNMVLLDLIADATFYGKVTVNMEYIGPDNRIVLGYEEPALRILNIRDPETGEYDLSMQYRIEHPFFAWAAGCRDSDISNIKNDQGYEGVVVVLTSGEWFKLKTDWYAALHHTKDSINSRRRLFECVINEATDDLKAMFKDDPVAMKMILDMEALVIPQYNAFIKNVESFYATNKELDRKSYAIKGQQEITQRPLFGLVMNLYLGKPNDYKTWAIKNYEMFGVKDEVLNVTADTRE